jgi:hypothetical protein
VHDLFGQHQKWRPSMISARSGFVRSQNLYIKWTVWEFPYGQRSIACYVASACSNFIPNFNGLSY